MVRDHYTCVYVLQGDWAHHEFFFFAINELIRLNVKDRLGSLEHILLSLKVFGDACLLEGPPTCDGDRFVHQVAFYDTQKVLGYYVFLELN